MAETTSTSKIVIEGVDDASAVITGIGDTVGTTLEGVKTKMDETATKSSGLKDVLTTGLGTAVGIIGTTVAGFVAGAGKEFLDFIGDSFKGAGEAAEGQRKLNDAITRLGESSPVSAEGASELADKYKDLAGGSDDAIVAAETMLLKYKGIKSEAFEPALQVALDLSAALGTDLTSASDMVGKALVAPGEGLGRLKSAGVAFTEEEEKLIKSLADTGQTAEAQNLILAKLAETTGGAAASKAGTFAGQMTILQETIADAGEGIAGEFLPILTELANEVLPEIVPVVKDVAGALVEGFKGFATLIKENWPIIKPLIAEVFRIVGELWKDPVQPALNQLFTALGKVVEFVKTNWPSIRATFESVFLAIGVIIENGKLAIKTIMDAVNTFVRDWNAAWESVKKFFDETWTGIVNFMDTLTKTFSSIGDSIVKGFLGAFNGLGDMLKNLVLAPVKAIVQTIKDALLPIVNTPVIGGLAQAAIDALPKFAEGGILQAGRVGVVGERGPELVTFNRAARIIPIPEAVRSGNLQTTLNVSVNVDGVSTDIDIERMAYRIAEVIGQRI